jgi:hypothetical protein
MGIANINELIGQLEQNELEFDQLPFDQLDLPDVEQIIRSHGHQYQKLPIRFKTPDVLEIAALAKCNNIRSVGFVNVTDDLACKSIDQWGLPAFMTMHDKNKTERVALHAIRNNPNAYRDIKMSRRTQEMSDLAFDLNQGVLHNIPESHLTSRMLMGHLSDRKTKVKENWPLRVFSQELADQIVEKHPHCFVMIPEQFLSAEAMAICAASEPNRIGRFRDAFKCIKAIRFSIEHLAGNTALTHEWLMNAEAMVDEDASLESVIAGDLHSPGKLNHMGIYAIMYRLDADNLEALAAHGNDNPLVADVAAALYGGRAAIKYFPKSPNRGKWLAEEMGL